MDKKNLENIFAESTGITIGTGDGICFGDTKAVFSPAGIAGVMKFHTAQVDIMLKKLLPNSALEMQLFHTRGFTFNEYQALFDVAIKEKDFHLHPAIRSLWLTKENERRRVIYKLDRQNFNDYFDLLAKCLARFNQSLLTFFFRIIATRQVPIQFPFAPYACYWTFGER